VNDSLTNLLSELVRIPSPNPPGDSLAIAAFIRDWLVNVGCSVQTFAPPNKPEALSVVATVGTGTPAIMMHAHIDTVPIAQDEAGRWSVDPYAATIHDNKLYGKGSVDDKAPLAAMMQLMADYARDFSSGVRAGSLILVAAAEEEVGGQLGTRWLADNGCIPPADFIIVGEQTANRAATAHKGVLRATVRATGRSVHATNPDRGVNAIVAMSKAVLALQAYHDSLKNRVHPLAGFPTCNVGVIHGGSTANAVPDSCVVLLDRRMIPGEDPEEVKRELQAVIASVDAAPAEVTVGDFLVSNWFQSTVESPLAQQFLGCIRAELSADPGPVGYLPGSDAKHLTGLTRGEMVIFGPGSYEVAHAFDEYVDLAELEATYSILKRFITELKKN
jgi:succinyl-diaminopimelate desuccinylase